MCFQQDADIGSVAAAHAALYRYAMGICGFHNYPVTGFTALKRALQLSHLIRIENIHTGLVKDKAGAESTDNVVQVFCKEVQVSIVRGAGLQAYIPVGGLLVKRIIMLAMHGKGIDLTAAPENIGRAVTLVDVEVYDQYPLHRRMVQQVLCGNGLVIEHTKAFPVSAACVVGTACYIKGYAVVKRPYRPIYSALYQQQLPLYQVGILDEACPPAFMIG